MGRIIRWSLPFLVAGGLAFFVWHKTRPQPIEVLVKPVERGRVEKTVANTRAGTVEACRRARLSPSVGGQIAGLPIHEGDTVQTGQLLLEIWNDDLKAQLTLAGREVEVAEARANAVCISAAQANRQANREKQLFKSQVGSEEQTDRAVAEAESLQAECVSAKANVLQAEARVAVAEVTLSRTRLLAPFSGIIAKIEGELNEYVTPSPVGVQTMPAVDLIEDSCYFVSAPIDEVDAAVVKAGMEVRITLDAFRGKTFAGTVRRMAPYVLDLEKQARTVEVEASFTNTVDFSLLLAGYSADVEILIEGRSDTLKIPTEAIAEGNRVYVFDPALQMVRVRDIATGLANWSATEIVSGLQEGEQVVVNIDKPDLKDGAAAVIKESP